LKEQNLKIYKLELDGTGAWVLFFSANNVVTPPYRESRAFFAGQPRIKIDRNTEATPKKSKAKLGDFTNVNYDPYPCFSQRAKDILGPHIDPLGQWLPLECEEAPYWLFNITNVVDALEVEKSKLAYFRDGGVMAIDEFAFHPEQIKDQLLFKTPQCSGSNNLVTQDFVDLVYQHQLTGFVFKLLWSSEAGPVSSNLKDYERLRITGLEPR
jgi:hypothetical protein